jgi:hypothetical protein
VTTGFTNTNLDSRFSTVPLFHGHPEFGAVYTEVTRLTKNLGAAPASKNLGSNEILTNQPLPLDTPAIGLDPQNVGLFSGSVGFAAGTVPLLIDYPGDRDAFQITLTKGQTLAIRQRAAGCTIDPILALWDSDGDWLATGSRGAAGGVWVATGDVNGDGRVGRHDSGRPVRRPADPIQSVSAGPRGFAPDGRQTVGERRPGRDGGHGSRRTSRTLCRRRAWTRRRDSSSSTDAVRENLVPFRGRPDFSWRRARRKLTIRPFDGSNRRDHELTASD